MSGEDMPELDVDGRGMSVVIVAASWHERVMDGLIAGAITALRAAGATEISLVRVPGSFELPIVAQEAAQSGADAVVALGVIIRGGTPHFEYVSEAATNGLTQAALSTGVPIGFGLLTCDTEEQALDRAGLPPEEGFAGSQEDKGGEAAQAALATVHALRRV